MNTEEPGASAKVYKREEAVPAPEVKTPVVPKQKADPLSVGDYIVMFILFSLPVVNLVLAIVWSLTEGGNPNRRNFARAYVILWLVILVIIIFAVILARVFFSQFLPIFQELIQGF